MGIDRASHIHGTVILTFRVQSATSILLVTIKGMQPSRFATRSMNLSREDAVLFEVSQSEARFKQKPA